MTTATAKPATRKGRKPATQPEIPQVTIPVEEVKKNEMYVFFDGPYSDCGESSHDGDERPWWSVRLATDLDEDPKYAYRVWNYEKAFALAEKICIDQKTKLIQSAVRA